MQNDGTTNREAHTRGERARRSRRRKDRPRRMLGRLSALSLAGALAVGAAACGDDATGPDDDPGDEHGEPAAVRLVLGGEAIATADLETATGEIHAHPGEETGHIAVEFVDADGDAIVFDDDFYLEVDVEDETVAEFEQDTPGEFGGHVHGHTAGETTMTFKLMHGSVGSGHPDWVSAAVPVHVEEHP